MWHMNERTRYMQFLTIEVIAMWITPKHIKEGGRANIIMNELKGTYIQTNKLKEGHTYEQKK